MEQYAIGLDIGTQSIGWAVVDLKNGVLSDAGVRLFEAGLQNLGEGEKEQSQNAERRVFRGMRRQKYRRQLRKRQMKRWLEKNGWWTELTDQQIRLSDPYVLRSAALERRLETWELARVLYHLAQRRGFKSNRKFGSKEEKGALQNGSEGIIGINSTEEAWEKSGKLTLGAYLATLSKEERKRSRYTQRKWYIDEFNLIWEKQQEFYPDIMTNEVRDHIRDEILFFQRPLKDTSHLVGECLFEKGEKRAPASHPLAQRFRVAQNLNNLKLTFSDTNETRRLTQEEYEKLELLLSEGSAKIELEDLPKKIHEWKHSHLPKKERPKFDPNSKVTTNLDHQRVLKGRSTEAQLKKVFGSRYSELSEDRILELWELLYKNDDPELVSKTGVERWKLSEEDAKALSEIRLEEKYFSLSLKAIENILPFMEKERLPYHEAMEKAGYNHALPDDENRILLKKLSPVNKEIRNPVVYAALTEVRKVVNCIIHRYGAPALIRIELARDLKQTPDQRFLENQKMKDREKENDRIRNACKELGVSQPKRADILKYQLWEECKGICIYSGRNIEASQLFSDQSGFINIDHIIPISRSMKDDPMNKVLVYQDQNAEKGDRTPFEWLGETEKFNSVVKRAEKYLPPEKQKLIKLKDTGEALDGFVQTQLNDTRYASREAVKYLKQVCYQVEAVKAGFVATLRNEWGLERGESKKGTFLQNPYLVKLELHEDELKKGKSRLDHRHHAIDAIVVACADAKKIAQINRERRKDLSGGTEQRKSIFSPPWPRFRDDVAEFVDNIFISYKTRRKVSGALHKETLYGVNLDPNGQVIKNDETGKTRYVVRKPLLSLSKKELENIVDDEVRESIKSAINACALKDGLDVTQDRDFAKITKELFKEGFRHPTGHTVIKKVRVYVDAEENIKVRELSHRAGKHAYAQSDSTHHTALYRMPDGKLEADMVSLWEATKRKRLKQPLYAPTFEGGELITTFVNKELLFFTKGLSPEQVEQLLAQFDPKDKSTYHVLFPYIYRFKTAASTSKQMAFLYHSLAKETVKTVKKPKGDLLRKTATPSSFRGFKLIVDPLGYVTEIIEIKR